ncbi:MAG: N-acetyltransferase [Candidatus Omnitrophica bacterium]|nr:N-acetyltransferase [Candidatus Omnitrophota bacterium]MCF7877181.1 N-acetyltransferase [Candidatus Omnitrophota bacterium]MCF7878000.1 N-acetyltransferase [Candidatus Omnitrophota bacterium]MCF7892908.1 N-acetyltransferase [Candidatus Omnitrophota bacterium]
MIRKIKIDEAKNIQRLINAAAAEGHVLERSLNYIYENIRDFWVYTGRDGKIVGCCGLHVVGWQSLAELKSLIVDKSFRRKNIGERLIKKALGEAKELGVSKVFALTFSPAFFKKYGFISADKNDLPHKIWTECLNCKHFPDCKEEAVIIEI